MREFKEKFNIKTTFIVGALVVLFMASVVSHVISKRNEKEYALESLRELYSYNEINDKTDLQNPLEGIDLRGKSAIVWDIKNRQVIFEKNADEVLPLASISKILLAAVSLDILSPNTEIEIEKEFLESEGDTGLLLDERWHLKDLLEFSLLTSSNDGAMAIASVAGATNLISDNYEFGRKEFVRLMNNKADSWGLENVYIKNETGLDFDEESQSGAYGTAREVALMFELLFKKYPDIIEATTESQSQFKSLSDVEHLAYNTNRNINNIPGIMASKTGYTTLAGGNLAIIFDPSIGRPVVAVILGSTFEERFSDMEKLVNAIREYVIQEKLTQY